MTPPAQSEIATATTSSSASQLAALLQGAGISRLDHTGWIRVTGEDRVRWLNGMVTNSIQQLKDGEGNYNFLLSVQGRIQGDATIFAEPDALLIETAASQLPNLIALLDRFIIMDDVELADASGTQSGLLVAGPRAQLHCSAQIGLNVEDLGTLQKRTMPGTPLKSPSSTPTALSSRASSSGPTPTPLRNSLRPSKAPAPSSCDAQSLEWLRILEGTPALRHRHPRPRAPAGDRPDPRPALRQRLLPRPGDRRAHPLPRQRPSHLQRLPPRRRATRRRSSARS